MKPWTQRNVINWRIEDPESPYELCWVAMMHYGYAEASAWTGSDGFKVNVLADLWDADENRDKDHEEGTFAAYLRYGSVCFDQTREVKKLEWQNPEEETFTVGCLEPVQQ
ncbi:hypothetical protein J3F83DRAFT_715865 [Trichoderma novae-zelandiae]